MSYGKDMLAVVQLVDQYADKKVSKELDQFCDFLEAEAQFTGTQDIVNFIDKTKELYKQRVGRMHGKI